MFEKLDKLREEVRRCEKRRDEANERLKAAQAKLKDAEASQILSEEVAKLLQLVASGQLSVPTAENKTETTTTEGTSSIYGDDDSDDNKEESEDEDY